MANCDGRKLEEPSKHYFTSVPSVTTMNTWIEEKQQLELAAFNRIQCDQLLNEEGQEHWGKLECFSVRIATVLRHMMLRAIGLQERHLDSLKGLLQERHLTIIQDRNSFGIVNDNDDLVSNKYEAQWLMQHFDMLFPHFFIANYVLKKTGGIKQVISEKKVREMIVVDQDKIVVWKITASLIDIKNTINKPGQICFKGTLDLKVERFQPKNVFNDYPFKEGSNATLMNSTFPLSSTTIEDSDK